MDEIELTIEEQDARLAKSTEQLDVQIAAKRERVRQLEDLAAQQSEFKRELEETVVRLRAKNQMLRQKQEAILVR